MTQGSTDTSWHVAVLTAFATLMVMTTLRNSGITFVGLMEEFNANRESSSWPISIQVASIHASALIVGMLQKRLSVIHIGLIGSVLVWSGLIASAFAPNLVVMSLTYGLLHGSGIGMVVVTLVVIIMSNFDKYRGTASGIRYIGETVSIVVFPKLLVYLEQKYGFRGMLLILGGILMHTTVCLFPFTEPTFEKRVSGPPENGHTPTTADTSGGLLTASGSTTRLVDPETANQSKTSKLYSVRLKDFARPWLYLMILSGVTAHFTHNIFLTTIIDFALDQGVTLNDGASIIAYSSIPDLLGGLVLPILADKGLLGRGSLVMCSHFLLGLFMIILPKSTNFIVVLSVSLCVVMFVACVINMKTVLMADHLGIEMVSFAIGLSGLVILPLLIGSPFIVGLFRDHLGAYDNLYRALGGFNCLVGFIFFVPVCSQNLRRNSRTTVD
ncbi:unnamed protein product [Ixodes hexagonus]